MKKLIALCSLFLIIGVTVTGCGKSNVKLDLKKIDEKLGTITSEQFYIQGINEAIEKNDKIKLENMENLFDFDFNSIFGFEQDWLSEYSVYQNKTTKELYAAFLPAKGKENDVKKAMKAYLDKLDVNVSKKNDTSDSYLLYAVSNQADEIFKTMKDCKMPIFSAMSSLNDELLKSLLGIDKKLVDEYLAVTPMMITNSNTVIILKPADGKKEEVEKAMETYMNKLEEQWKTYLPDQYELVKKRMEKELGDYLIYIVSSDNDAVFKMIQEQQMEK